MTSCPVCRIQIPESNWICRDCFVQWCASAEYRRVKYLFSNGYPGSAAGTAMADFVRRERGERT